MKKRFKSKKKVKYKFILFLLLIISSLVYIENNITITLSKKNIIENLWKSGNKFSNEEIRNEQLSYELYQYLKDNIFNSPIKILNSQIVYDEDSSIKNTFSYVEKTIPRIYIYNSHQGEKYSTKYLEDYNITPDVITASKMLKDKLENLGIPTIVEESDILGYMKQNNLNHGGSYIASRHFLTSIIKKYPNMDLYIDLHRDSANYSVTHTQINGKDCARILFVIGLEYDTYENNLKIVTDINNIILSKYPTLTRGILKKQGYGVNGVYNQDLSSNVILIEIGGNENNIEEVNNTLDLIAEVIGDYINEKD